jgi:hypothetical protein
MTDISPSQQIVKDKSTPGSSTTYSNFYKPGLDVNTYATEFIIGHTPAAPNSTILPGNRYFLPIVDKKYDTNGNVKSTANRKCYDSSGNQQELSVLIDNVQRTKVIGDSSYQGLFYSLYASLQDYEKGITNVDLSKNAYSCKPIKAYLDDSTKNRSETYYVLNSDTEGFMDKAAYRDASSAFIREKEKEKEKELKSKSPGAKDFVPAAPLTTPILKSPDGSPQIDVFGDPKYVLDGTGGGPNQYNLASPNAVILQDLAKQVFPINGTVAEGAAKDLKNLLNTPAFSIAGFTTIDGSDISINKYQNHDNPLQDPIFLFYIFSLLAIFSYILYNYSAKRYFT